MNKLKNKLLEKCIKHCLNTLNIKVENISKIKEEFESISISKNHNFKILTNWDLSSINKENLYLKL